LIAPTTYPEKKLTIAMRLKEYFLLAKMRLTFLVVISAVTGYFMQDEMVMNEIWILIAGGFFVTAASNGFNQILERDLDKMMKRTQNRPLVKNTISVREAFVVSLIWAIGGLALLALLNPLCFFLGLLSLFMYVAVYTPMKRVSSWAVFIGAFPGAMPPLLGYVGATGEFGLLPGILFLVQFMWQFPHFWAIAWVLDDDYKLAGFRLLPSKSGRSRSSSLQILIFTLVMIVASFLPWVIDITGTASLIICGITGLLFYRLAYKLHYTQEISDARKLMFASFIVLPVIQIVYVINRIL
jgi:protoheme IX farnesyltransferase